MCFLCRLAARIATNVQSNRAACPNNRAAWDAGGWDWVDISDEGAVYKLVSVSVSVSSGLVLVSVLCCSLVLGLGLGLTNKLGRRREQWDYCTQFTLKADPEFSCEKTIGA